MPQLQRHGTSLVRDDAVAREARFPSAFSAYFAAQKSPSVGDAVGGKSLCEWLQEKSLLPLLRGRAGDEGPATMPLSVLAGPGAVPGMSPRAALPLRECDSSVGPQ